MAKKAKSGRDRRRRERSRRRPTRATRSKVKNRTQKPRHAGKATIKREQRAYDDDPLAFVDTLMKRFGEAGGREAFLKFVADNDPDSIKQAPALADLAARVKYDPKGSAPAEPNAQRGASYRTTKQGGERWRRRRRW